MNQIVLLSLITAALAAAQTPQELFQQGLVKERSEGKLEEAIGLYRRAASAAGKDRSLAAKALVQLASSYEKLGSTESRKIYERVVREFTDQKEAVAMARVRLGATVAGDGPRSRQVWTGPKVDASGTISDGGLLSYTDWETGDLAIHDFFTGRDSRLANKGELATGSAISRDGKQVAYGWRVPSANPSSQGERFELRLIDVGGGQPRTLLSGPDIRYMSASDWSPDGKWLAVKVDRAGGTSQIALVSTADGAVRVLKTTDWRGASKIAFSPGGDYLAFDLPVSGGAEQRDVYVLPLNGGRETAVVVHPASDRLLAWSPDGKSLLVVSDRGGSPGIWRVPVADGKPRGAAELVKANVDPAPLGFTKDGAFYYRALTAGRDIVVASVDFESGKVLAQPTVISQPHAGSNDSPQWSPDGKFLAYFTSKGGSSANRLTALAIRSMETGNVRELKPDLDHLNGSSHSRPLWSPDAKSFFVAGTDRNGRYGIYRVDSTTGNTTPVVQGAGQEYPIARALSPDGRRLILTRMVTGGIAVAVRDLPGGAERELIRRWRMGDVKLSPDGRFVALTAFVRDSPSSPLLSSLLVIPVEGGEPREVFRAVGSEWLGALVEWSPDGKSLTFRKFVTGSTRGALARIPVEGGVPRTPGLSFEVGRSPHLHPDGHRVVYTTIDDPKYEVRALDVSQ